MEQLSPEQCCEVLVVLNSFLQRTGSSLGKLEILKMREFAKSRLTPVVE